MDYNLEKVIAQYAKEAMTMANLTENTGTVPEPEQVPEPFPVETILKEPFKTAEEPLEGEIRWEVAAELKPETEEAEIFKKTEIFEKTEELENPKNEKTEIFEKLENLENMKNENAKTEEDDMSPNFDDYISRRNRSWERGTSQKTQNQNPNSPRA